MPSLSRSCCSVSVTKFVLQLQQLKVALVAACHGDALAWFSPETDSRNTTHPRLALRDFQSAGKVPTASPASAFHVKRENQRPSL
jgi:hypothetical protein